MMATPFRVSIAVVVTAALSAVTVLIPDPSGLLSLQQVLQQVAGPDAAPLPRLIPALMHLDTFERRVAAHPLSANSHYMLASLQARHARESGEEGRYLDAERMLRQALVLRPQYAEAELALGRVLNSQHRFAEASDLARSLMQTSSGATAAASVLFDALMGQGEYEAAATVADELTAVHSGPGLLARRAELAEIHGRDAEALDLLLRVAAAAKDRYIARSEMAWYLFCLAEFHHRRGHHQEALAGAEAALRLEPAHLGAQVTPARLLAAEGTVAEATAAFESIVQRLPHPEHLAALADLYRRLGRDRDAESTFAAALEAGRAGGEGEDRPMARLLAGHRMRPAEAVRRARRDLQSRHDVEAHDTLAWALYAAGEYGEAADASAMALRFGTRRADFHLHAAAIAEALGRHGEARRHRQAASEINPRARQHLAASGSSAG